MFGERKIALLLFNVGQRDLNVVVENSVECFSYFL